MQLAHLFSGNHRLTGSLQKDHSMGFKRLNHEGVGSRLKTSAAVFRTILNRGAASYTLWCWQQEILFKMQSTMNNMMLRLYREIIAYVEDLLYYKMMKSTGKRGIDITWHHMRPLWSIAAQNLLGQYFLASKVQNELFLSREEILEFLSWLFYLHFDGTQRKRQNTPQYPKSLPIITVLSNNEQLSWGITTH